MVGPSKQATKQAYTHVCNPVTLVWDSLRLTPIIVPKDTHKTKSCGSTVEYSNLAKEEKGKVSISSNTWQLYISHILTPPCHSAHFTNNHCSLTKLVRCLRKAYFSLRNKEWKTSKCTKFQHCNSMYWQAGWQNLRYTPQDITKIEAIGGDLFMLQGLYLRCAKFTCTFTKSLQTILSNRVTT